MSNRNIKVLHIEPTDVCQATCPLCARETDPAFDKKAHTQLTVDQIKQRFNEDFICNLDKMFMCGNYGDPAAGKHTLEIFEYFRSVNPTITLGMNTNGGLQNMTWWIKLARLLKKPNDFVVFSIDGLEDTNHIYRKNVNWELLEANVASFIAAGGPAHWDMLVYKHNQHQVDECESVARKMKFKWFRAKVSKRPFAYGMEAPVDWHLPTHTAGKIECHALAEQSVYMDAHTNVSPCCWLGARQDNFITDIDKVSVTWNTSTPNPVCSATCATKENITVFESQWQREVELAGRVNNTLHVVKENGYTSYNTDVGIV